MRGAHAGSRERQARGRGMDIEIIINEPPFLDEHVTIRVID